MDSKTKEFIVQHLVNTIRKVQSAIDVKDPKGYAQLYEIHLEYIYKVLEILFRENLQREYDLVKSDIELIDRQDGKNTDKMIEICGKLIELAKGILDS